MHYSDAEIQSFRWQQSYSALLAVLQRHGVDDAVGKGDFWLLDDNYGNPEHLLCITRMGVLTQDLVAELQSVLRAPTLDGWILWIQLELAAADGKAVPLEGLVVSADAVEEHWNRQALRESFGDDFHWPAGWEPAADAAYPPPDIPATPDPAFHAQWLEEAAELDSEWRQAHDELRAVLQAHVGQGMPAPAGIELAEDPGNQSHSLVVRDIRLLNRALVDQLREVATASHWLWQSIVVVLDLQAPDGEPLAPEGFLIHGHVMEEAWDPVRLKGLFGDQFDWPVTATPPD